jgi:hypothetical protein
MMTIIQRMTNHIALERILFAINSLKKIFEPFFKSRILLEKQIEDRKSSTRANVQLSGRSDLIART